MPKPVPYPDQHPPLVQPLIHQDPLAIPDIPQPSKDDIITLLCILRSRCLPAIPYETIALIIYSYWPDQALNLIRLSAESRGKYQLLDYSQNIKTVLARVLEKEFRRGEQDGNDIWRGALEKSTDFVQTMIHIIALGGEETKGKHTEKAFDILTPGDAEVQSNWRRGSDWKAGSIPLGRPERTYSEQTEAIELVRNFQIWEDVDGENDALWGNEDGMDSGERIESWKVVIKGMNVPIGYEKSLTRVGLNG